MYLFCYLRDSVQSSHYGGSDRAEGNQYRRSDGSGGGGGRKHSPMVGFNSTFRWNLVVFELN